MCIARVSKVLALNGTEKRLHRGNAKAVPYVGVFVMQEAIHRAVWTNCNAWGRRVFSISSVTNFQKVCSIFGVQRHKRYVV